MNLLLPLIVAMVITVALIPLLERRALALHLIDGPGPRKVHTHTMPRVGGIAMAAGGLVSLLIWLPPDARWVAYFLGASIVFLFGVLDDRTGLSPVLKLAGQAIAVTIVVLVGSVTIDSISLTTRIQIPELIAIPLSVLFLLGITNAINLADGLDGLAGGTSFLTLAVILALALGHDVPELMTVTVIVMGSLLGFLRYNSFPARVFMGDGGSQLLGFTLGVLAINLTQDGSVPYSAMLPLLLLGLPIIDMLGVIAVRLQEGRSPFVADRKHLHHRLLDLGFDHFEAVALIYLVQGTLLILAWFMRYRSDLAIIGVFVAVTLATLGGMYYAQRRSWRWPGIGSVRLGQLVARRVPWLKAPKRLPRWGNAVAWALLTLYLLLVAATTSARDADVAWLAVGLAGILCTAALGLLPASLVERPAHAAVFVAVAIAVYLDHIEIAGQPAFWAVKWVLFATLAATVVIRLRFWRERRFEITTLDILVVFIALVVPNLPGIQGTTSELGVSLAKFLILLYAVEMLISHSERVRRWLWLGSALALGLIAIRGLLI